MSRGNYYYARGWVGHGNGGFIGGGGGRLGDLGDGLTTSIIFLILGVMLQAFSAFGDVNWLSSTLPIFSLFFGVAGVIGMLAVAEEGIFYVGGWTFVSMLLYIYGVIGAGEFLTDLIPVGILFAVAVFYLLENIGVFDSLGTGRYGL